MSGAVQVTKEVSRSQDVRYGRATIGTSAAPLGETITLDANSGKMDRGILVKCDAGNSGPVYFGNGTVSTATGFPVDPGNFLSFPVDDPSLIFAVSDDIDQLVYWIGS